MDVSSHIAHRRNSESNLVSRDNRRLLLEINRVQSIQDVLIKNIDKKMNIIEKEIKSYRYSNEERKQMTAEKFPIYLPFWKEWKLSDSKRQADISRNREINQSKINKTDGSIRDKIRSFIQNISRVEETEFTKTELVTQGRAQGQRNEQLLSINPSVVGMDSNIASVFSVGEVVAVLKTADSDRQTENLNKKTDDIFLIAKKPDESIRPISPVVLSTWRQCVTPLPQQNFDTLLSTYQKEDTQLPFLPSVDALDALIAESATQKSDWFCSGITKQSLYTSEFNLRNITENQHIIQSCNSTVSAVDDKMSTKRNTQRRSSIIASPGELRALLKKELKIMENNGHFPQTNGQTTIKTRRHSILPNLEEFNERRQSDGNVFRLSQNETFTPQSPRSETEASDVRKVNMKPEHKRRKSTIKAPVLDREIYNADGSLRTIYCLPSVEESWKQAQQARYIRSKCPIEKEIPVEEIFFVKDNVNIAESDTNTAT